LQPAAVSGAIVSIAMHSAFSVSPGARPLPRRTFIRNASLTLAAAAAVRSPLAIAAPTPSANRRLGVAFIGCGDRARSLLKECVDKRAAWNLEFPAVCDVWSVNRESTAASILKSTGRRPRTFSRHQDLLALPEVDAVVIATPDFAHAPILVDAARARKHAYVEKPMATRLEDANAAVEAVESHGIVCQVGTQFRSQGNFIGAARLLESGVLGQLIKVETSYHRSVPSWVRDFKRRPT
jgi:predicted dehydrogenase